MLDSLRIAVGSLHAGFQDMDLWQTFPCKGQNKLNLHTAIKTKFSNIFCNFSRSRVQGKSQLKVKVMILKILKLSKYPLHPEFQFEARK